MDRKKIVAFNEPRTRTWHWGGVSGTYKDPGSLSQRLRVRQEPTDSDSAGGTLGSHHLGGRVGQFLESGELESVSWIRQTK